MRVLLTGSTQGIGAATAHGLAPLADILVLHGLERESDVASFLSDIRRRHPNTTVVYLAGDYGRLDDVESLLTGVRSHVDGLDLMINNAARPGPAERTVSGDGHEVTFQTNYLAPVALTSGLLSLLHSADAARLLNVASATHYSARISLDDLELERKYSGVAAYAHSKLALVTYTCWLARQLEGSTVEAVSMHPGVISTGLLHSMFSVGGASAERGMANILSVAQHARGINGFYFDETSPAGPHPDALDVATQERLMDVTARALSFAGLPGPQRTEHGGHSSTVPGH